MATTELGAFLRARRSRVTPAELGLPAGGQRRTAGLRREELAASAGISVDYYIRLEQGRERHPSSAVVAALAQALRLNEEEHAHLYQLAQQTDALTVRRPDPCFEVAYGLRQLVETVRPFPAYVLSRASDVLIANPEALELFTGLADWPAERRNTLRYTFCHPAARHFYVDWPKRASDSVANLRTLLAAEPEAPDLLALVAELAAASGDFGRLWQRHDVQMRRSGSKAVRHPALGEINLDVQVLHADAGQRFCVFQAPIGGHDHEAVLELSRLSRAAR